MINNDTVATATIFGLSTGLMTEQWITIIIGAIAVGVIQPFFRILWKKVLLDRKDTKMAYGKKRKTKKKEEKKKKRKKRK
jgi:phosphotransferase system  glucose/maltose/N-acetylglucosamine-specific IIC component